MVKWSASVKPLRTRDAGRSDDAMPKLIVVMPAYNESERIVSVLNQVAPYVDAFVLIDDASKDNTVELMKTWREQHPAMYLIGLSQNVGASGALKAGYIFVRHLLETGAIAPDDLIVEMDADGQHDPQYIPRLKQPFLEGWSVDVVLARRDFSNYPRYKRYGNLALTLIASCLSGFHYHDVESNFRVSRADVFPRLLEYFSGYRYSGAFEVGIILACLKYRVQNDITVQVPFYREGARAVDGLHVLAMGLKAWGKVRLGLRNPDLPGMTESVLRRLSEN